MTNEVKFLFLGCSLSEDRYLEILKRVKARNKEDANYHFAIISAPKDEREFSKRQKYLASCGIAPIWYDAGHYEQINDYLSRLIDKVQISELAKFENERIDERDISLYFVDPIARMAHDNNTDQNLARAILVQSEEYTRSTKTSQSPFTKLFTEINKANQDIHCPLTIRGKPGTGKSTLLSLLFLNIPKPLGRYSALIDLHRYDETRPDSSSVPVPDLEQVLQRIEKEIKSHDSSVLFIDGINGYARMNIDREKALLKKLEQWKLRRNVQFVFAIGELDNNQFPPLIRTSSPIPFVANHTIELAPIDATTADFRFLVDKGAGGVVQ